MAADVESGSLTCEPSVNILRNPLYIVAAISKNMVAARCLSCFLLKEMGRDNDILDMRLSQGGSGVREGIGVAAGGIRDRP